MGGEAREDNWILCYNTRMNEVAFKRQKIVVLTGVILVVVALIAATAWVVLHDNNKLPVADQSKNKSISSGDAARKKHALELASRLSVLALVLHRPVLGGQAGLDQIATDNDGKIVTDPTTGKPYIFTEDQSAMKVGEAYFRIGATCDNKVKGSDGKGMIVDSIDDSVAVTIKLESSGFACESSL